MSDSGKPNNLPGDRGRGPVGEERELKIRAASVGGPCYPGSSVQQSFGAARGILRGLKLVRSRLDRALIRGWQTTAPFPSLRPKVILGSAASAARAPCGTVQDAPRADPDAQRDDAGPARRQDALR